ncbi:hypothetical protein LguiA_036622 [Lonicera macranthoides]
MGSEPWGRAGLGKRVRDQRRHCKESERIEMVSFMIVWEKYESGEDGESEEIWEWGYEVNGGGRSSTGGFSLLICEGLCVVRLEKKPQPTNTTRAKISKYKFPLYNPLNTSSTKKLPSNADCGAKTSNMTPAPTILLAPLLANSSVLSKASKPPSLALRNTSYN